MGAAEADLTSGKVLGSGLGSTLSWGSALGSTLT